ncbi:MAG: SdiA-regulated domain-containing protein [Bacteroidia bacterium]|nr:SdiA-regulated domain-containing protein [Bacteroidia bacterium]
MGKLLLCSLLILAEIPGACVRDEVFTPDDPGNNGTIRDSVFVLTIPEPSDLTFTSTNNSFFTVSDNTGNIYEISKKGDVLKTFDFTGNDLEGVCIDKINGDIYVAQERLGQIVQLSSTGSVKQTITLANYKPADTNSSLEGISKNGDTLYIVKEKNPGLLIKFHLITKSWSSISLSFALDFSAISYDASDNTLWILSDESHALFHCDLQGNPFSKQNVEVTQPEGIAIDHVANSVWVVGDSDKKLFKIVLKQINL